MEVAKSCCFRKKGSSIKDLLRILSRSFVEHWNASKKGSPPPKNRSVCAWKRPVYGQIKLNCDAAVGHSHAVIVVVVRDWRRSLVFSCSKKVNTNVLVQAEVEALRWSACLALN